MLYLRTDTELRGIKGVSFHTIGSDTHTAEIVLVERDCRTGKAEIPGLKAGLCKGDVATHALCISSSDKYSGSISRTDCATEGFFALI